MNIFQLLQEIWNHVPTFSLFVALFFCIKLRMFRSWGGWPANRHWRLTSSRKAVVNNPCAIFDLYDSFAPCCNLCIDLLIYQLPLSWNITCRIREFCSLTCNLSVIFRLSKSWSRKPFPYSHQKISWHAFLLDGSHVANEASMQDLAEADTMMATEGTFVGPCHVPNFRTSYAWKPKQEYRDANENLLNIKHIQSHISNVVVTASWGGSGSSRFERLQAPFHSSSSSVCRTWKSERKVGGPWTKQYLVAEVFSSACHFSFFSMRKESPIAKSMLKKNTNEHCIKTFSDFYLRIWDELGG